MPSLSPPPSFLLVIKRCLPHEEISTTGVVVGVFLIELVTAVAEAVGYFVPAGVVGSGHLVS